MAITLPEPQLRHAEQMAAAEGYETVDGYLADLIDRERERKLAEIRALLAEAEEDFARGDVFEMTDELLEQMKAEGRARRASRG